jgi:hypothetical protein
MKTNDDTFLAFDRYPLWVRGGVDASMMAETLSARSQRRSVIPVIVAPFAHKSLPLQLTHIQWLAENLPKQRVFWISGGPGVGKTAVGVKTKRVMTTPLPLTITASSSTRGRTTGLNFNWCELRSRLL